MLIHLFYLSSLFTVPPSTVAALHLPNILNHELHPPAPPTLSSFPLVLSPWNRLLMTLARLERIDFRVPFPPIVFSFS
jgi:hypothetical protein